MWKKVVYYFYDLNFANLKLVQNTQTDEIMLYNYEQDFIVDRVIYEFIVDYLRTINGFEKES